MAYSARSTTTCEKRKRFQEVIAEHADEIKWYHDTFNEFLTYKLNFNEQTEDMRNFQLSLYAQKAPSRPVPFIPMGITRFRWQKVLKPRQSYLIVTLAALGNVASRLKPTVEEKRLHWCCVFSDLVWPVPRNFDKKTMHLPPQWARSFTRYGTTLETLMGLLIDKGFYAPPVIALRNIKDLDKERPLTVEGRR